MPIYAILLDVGAKPAVPLSKCTILGAAIGNFVSIGFGKHPNADRPLIDYETSTFMQAGELMGVTFGVLLNLLLPFSDFCFWPNYLVVGGTGCMTQ